MRKHTIQYIKGCIEAVNGYKLKSTEYINSREKLDILCPNGHVFKMSYTDFNQGCRCSICFKKVKHSYQYIKEQFAKEGYTLLSKTYKGNKTKLLVQCSEGHISKMKWNDFQQGHRCSYCTGNTKYTFEYIKKYIESFGYKLLTPKYENTDSKIKVQCSKGHEYKVTWYHFHKRNQRCPICTDTTLLYQDVKDYIESFEGYKLLSKEYKNNRTKLEVQCPLGHKYNVTYINFYKGARCPKCSYINGQSKAEKEVYNILKLFTTTNIITNDRTCITNPKTGYSLELDMWMPELSKAIEFNGTYWHSLPNVKYRDQIKQAQCKAKGINLLVIQEQQWLNNIDDCINNIKEFLQD